MMLLLLLKKSQVIIVLTITDLISNYFQFFTQFLTDTIFLFSMLPTFWHTWNMKMQSCVYTKNIIWIYCILRTEIGLYWRFFDSDYFVFGINHKMLDHAHCTLITFMNYINVNLTARLLSICVFYVSIWHKFE